jgi:tRNA threonylcarbamoyladenosine biosynthesis protein TsaB
MQFSSRFYIPKKLKKKYNMGLTLGIDTSSIDLGLGLVLDGQNVAAHSRYCKNSHAEHIADSVSFLLNSHSISIDNLSSVAIAVGPGSFTGLRIGIAFVKGFCLLRKVTIAPCSSLLSMALSVAPFLSPQSDIVSVFDARNSMTYWARFRKNDDNSLSRVTADIRTPVETLTGELKPSDSVIIDTMGFSKSDLFNTCKQYSSCFLANELPLNRGLALALYANALTESDSIWCTTADLAAHYLCESYAIMPTPVEVRVP